MRTLALVLFLLLSCLKLHAQEFSATIVDAKSNAPIPYVAVQIAVNKGVITNEEGVFVIDLEAVTDHTITVSCLGYTTLSISISDIQASNNIIELDPSINELETVYLSNSRPNVDSIIARANRQLKTNYKSDTLNFKFFQRTTSYFDFDNLDFEVKKASHFKKRQLEKANNDLKAMANSIVTSNAVVFQDVSGELKVLHNKAKKLEVSNATQVLNTKKDFSLDNIQKRAYDVVLRYLDTTKTFKLKTGLFKVEDSLSLANNSDEKVSTKTFEINNLKSSITSVLSQSQLGTNSMLKTVLNSDNYDYTLLNVSTIEDDILYVIAFEPRRSRANFTGTLYVSDERHAILKMDYRYAKGKRGDKLNLRLILGIKYIENVNQGTIIFTKNDFGSYEPRYIKHESGEYFYLNRPLKFIENSAAKNKTSFNIKLEGSTMNREELLFIDVNPLDIEAFNAMVELKSVPYEELRKYDAKKWTGQETIAPSLELKQFEAKE